MKERLNFAVTPSPNQLAAPQRQNLEITSLRIRHVAP
jgi:hypothetical protein